MLIPENGKWRWNDGPLCDSKEEAVKTAKTALSLDTAEQVFVMDSVETVEFEDD